MNNILLTSDQIVDLIFEKKLTCDSFKIRCEDSGIETIAKIEERLIHGKSISRKNSEIRKKALGSDIVDRERFA